MRIPLPLLTLLVLPSLAPAGPPDTSLSAIRRTTIVAADVPRTLAFYRDLLGFEIIYDTVVTDPAQLALLGVRATRGRAIALRSADSGGDGTLGIFSHEGVRATPRCEGADQSGRTALLLLTRDARALQERLRSAGIPIVRELIEYDAGAGATLAFSVYDPNCLIVSFAQLAE